MLLIIMNQKKRSTDFDLQSRQNVAGVLNKLVEINDRNAVPALVLEEHLQLPQLIKRSHIYANQSPPHKNHTDQNCSHKNQIKQ